MPRSKVQDGGSRGQTPVLDDIAQAVEQPGGQPSDYRWNPPFSGDIDMRIAADGTWYYLGTEIRRKRLVRLFSTVLRREPDSRYYLVTPVEKLGITVEDVPFLAVAMEVSGRGRDQVISLTTNVEDTITVNRSHPLRFETGGRRDEPRPFVMVRDGLEAVVSRAVFYDLVELGTSHEIDDESWFGVWSHGAFFAMTLAAELDL